MSTFWEKNKTALSGGLLDSSNTLGFKKDNQKGLLGNLFGNYPNVKPSAMGYINANAINYKFTKDFSIKKCVNNHKPIMMGNPLDPSSNRDMSKYWVKTEKTSSANFGEQSEGNCLKYKTYNFKKNDIVSVINPNEGGNNYHVRMDKVLVDIPKEYLTRETPLEKYELTSSYSVKKCIRFGNEIKSYGALDSIISYIKAPDRECLKYKSHTFQSGDVVSGMVIKRSVGSLLEVELENYGKAYIPVSKLKPSSKIDSDTSSHREVSEKKDYFTPKNIIIGVLGLGLVFTTLKLTKVI